MDEQFMETALWKSSRTTSFINCSRISGKKINIVMPPEMPYTSDVSLLDLSCVQRMQKVMKRQRSRLMKTLQYSWASSNEVPIWLLKSPRRSNKRYTGKLVSGVSNCLLWTRCAQLAIYWTFCCWRWPPEMRPKRLKVMISKAIDYGQIAR